ncbi:MAG: Hsp20/alpha crystallin family protein [Candidatus Bathyarchaeia archaeon]|nr:Hsp20/alpha crystallin family protein [Candidatus Bathyarchaeota archaeon]
MAQAHGERRPSNLLRDVILAVSVAIAILLLILIFKIKGGLIGMVLGAVTVAALIYWLREVERIFRQETQPDEADWLYEIIENGENIIFIARVPGPPDKVKVKIADGTMEIRGGGDFLRRVEIPRGVKILEKSYSNGVLRIKFQRAAASKSSRISSQV